MIHHRCDERQLLTSILFCRVAWQRYWLRHMITINWMRMRLRVRRHLHGDPLHTWNTPTTIMRATKMLVMITKQKPHMDARECLLRPILVWMMLQMWIVPENMGRPTVKREDGETTTIRVNSRDRSQPQDGGVKKTMTRLSERYSEPDGGGMSYAASC